MGKGVKQSHIHLSQTGQEKDRQMLLQRGLSILLVLGILIISALIFIHRDFVASLGSVGYVGVVIVCFICNATVFAPAPSLVVVVAAAVALNPVLVALCGALGTSLGECVGYGMGVLGKRVVDFDTNRIAAWVKKYGIVPIFVFAFLPLPLFDVVGVAAGYLKIRFVPFFVSCFLGKLGKMLVYAMFADYFIQTLQV